MSPQQIIDKLKSLKVLVLGDGILDRYTYGKVNRISREAPIPVFEVTNSEERLGGAFNTALNAKQFVDELKVVSVFGNDEAGNKLDYILNLRGIDTSLCLKLEYVKTTVKERFVCKKQQVFRADLEEPWELKSEEKGILVEKIKQGISWADCILASDHSTSFFSEEVFNLIGKLTQEGEISMYKKPLYLDTRAGNFKKIKSCSVFKVNQADASSILGEEVNNRNQLDKFAQVVMDNINTNIIIVTLGDRGCYVYSENSGRIYDAQVVEISDVSGAGDTFLAIFSLIFTVLKQVDVSATLANRAGARVVQRFGTSFLTKEELIQDIGSVII